MGRVGRYLAMAAVMDFTIYVALSLAPQLAESWGASRLALGALPVAWGVSYSLTALFGGRFSDRISRTSLARVGLTLILLACVGFTFATATWHFYLGLPLVAFGMACFWPPLQAAIADESTPETLTRNLGGFNVCWSLGKGLGVLSGGFLFEEVGQSGFLLAAFVAAVLLLVLPRVPRGGGRGEPLAPGEESFPPSVRNRFRIAALLANFAAFGVATTCLNHYPRWNSVLSRGGRSYGVVVGGIFLAQTLVFTLLLFRTGWHYRKRLHLGLQAGAVIATAALATRLPVPALLPFVLFLGAALALSYFASIYYSLHSDLARGGRAGLHEAVIGTGNFLVPLAAGGVATLSGSDAAPYWFAAAVLLLSLFAQAFLLRGLAPRRRTSAARERA